ncbi:MAG: hypothetical protein ACHQZQ_04790 [SAR324 cluster bacterium]
MKPKSVLTVMLALALSGGLLWAFPALWMGLILVLLGLLAGEAALIRRSLKVARADDSVPSLRVSRAPQGVVAAFTNLNGTSAKPALDPAAFARFRAHLETVEQERSLRPEAPTPSPGEQTAQPEPSAPAPGTAKPALSKGAAGGDAAASGASADADRVVLSNKTAARRQPVPATPKVKSSATYGPQRGLVLPGGKRQGARKTAVAAEPAAPAQMDEAEGPDLFADLRPAPLPARPTPLLPPDEQGARPKDAPDSAPPSDEAAPLLRLAEEAMRRGDVSGARAALDQHLDLMPADRASWGARRLEVRVAALNHEPQRALDAFEAMLAAGFSLKAEGVAALMGDLLDGAKADLADSLRVSLLLKTLAAFRQAANRPAMDAVYRLLIEAQERVGDERKLVQFLKNHLEIKKVMGETAGQVDLIDQIGNRLFKLGETAEAREYYELGLKIRADLQQAEATRTSAKSGTTPQPA